MTSSNKSKTSRRCKATSRSGNPCKRFAIPGGFVCAMHGGNAPQVRAHAAVRLELENWGLGQAVDDPGEVLLRLVTQSRLRVEQLSAALAEKVDELGLEETLVGDSLVATESGDLVKVGEYARQLARWEAEERDRLASFTSKAVAAGLAERQVRLAERQGALLAQVMMMAMADPSLGFTDRQRDLLPSVLSSIVMNLEAGKQ